MTWWCNFGVCHLNPPFIHYHERHNRENYDISVLNLPCGLLAPFALGHKGLHRASTIVGKMMILWLFWLIAVALTVVVGLTFVQALRKGTAASGQHPDLQVYRDQLAEVERDLTRGTLSADEAQRLRVEVSRRLLDADRAVSAETPYAAKGSLYTTFAVVALVLGGSFWLYTSLGAAGYPDLPLSTRLALAEEAYVNRPSQTEAESAAKAKGAATADAEFLTLMEKLRAAVASRPDDVTGLDLLARNETALGNYADALKAQTHLVKVLGPKASPDQRLMVAQIMIAAAGGYVSPEAEDILLEVLKLDPENGMARYFSGLMFAQVGRPDRAFQLWEPLLAKGPADAPWAVPVRADIQAVADEAGIKFTLADETKGPTAADMEAAGELSVEDRQAMIEGMVGQLEGRLMTEGGPTEEWLKLINAVSVLNQPERGKAAVAAALAALAADPAAVKALQDAAAAAGFAP